MYTVSPKIKRLWFKDERIWIETDDGEILSRPLEAFPALKEAKVSDREHFRIGRRRDDVRWEELDEDIHISSFYDTTEPNYENDIAHMCQQSPHLSLGDIARRLGIHRTLLLKYIYGMKQAGEPFKERLRSVLTQ